jgi:hypothetical protein
VWELFKNAENISESEELGCKEGREERDFN